MSLFDLRTAYLVMGLFYLLMPGILWFALRAERSTWVAAWCLGGVATGIGIFVLATRGLAPAWFSLVVGNAMVVAGMGLRLWSLQRELGWRPGGAVHAVGLASTMLVYESIRSGMGNLPLASMWVTGAQGALCAGIGILAWELARREKSLHARLIAAAYAIVSVALLVRVIAIAQAWGNANLAADPRATPDLIAVSVAGIVVAVVSHLGYLGLHLERTKRREIALAEEEARQESTRRFGAQVAQLERHRSLGLVAMSLSHELTQPLAAIAVQARTAQRAASGSGDDTREVLATLSRITDNAIRAGSIIESIRAFIRPAPKERERLELAGLAREVASLVEAEARGAGVRMVLPPEGSRAWVLGDRIPLSQVILNAYRNAIDAAKVSSRREIRVSAAVEEGRVRLRVRDFGPGLTEEALRRAGEPLFTTKDGGLGVGLAVSRALAEQHGGSLSLANVEDGGALFELDLPAIEVPPA